MPTVWNLRRWWRRQPPVELLAAAYLKYTPPPDESEIATPEEFADIERQVMARFSLPDKLKKLH